MSVMMTPVGANLSASGTILMIVATNGYLTQLGVITVLLGARMLLAIDGPKKNLSVVRRDNRGNLSAYDWR